MTLSKAVTVAGLTLILALQLAPKVNALTCSINEKKVTDEHGKEYCQSTDISG